MPVVLISHGAPDALLSAPDAVSCWREMSEAWPEPSAILVISAHWEARQPTAGLAGAPETTHDFSGFSPALHRMQHPAPGAPALAERVAALLRSAGIAAELHPTLLAYRSAPRGAEAHPSEEHFLPLFVGLGAAGDALPQRHQPPFSYGGLAMDAYVRRGSLRPAGRASTIDQRPEQF